MQAWKPLEAFHVIPLNKNPGMRPIGVGEILRRILGEAIVSITRDHVIKNSVWSLQDCAGQVAGCEAAIQAMKDIFDEEDTEAVILIDAANAFNSINRKAIFTMSDWFVQRFLLLYLIVILHQHVFLLLADLKYHQKKVLLRDYW